MPWDKKSFKRHNKKLSNGKSGYAAKIANAILRESGDEGKAIRIANAMVKREAKRKRRGG